MVCIIILSANGEKRLLKTGLIVDAPTGETVAKAVRKARPAEEITRFETESGPVILWGWRDGKKGTENKHTLPPKTPTLFGDIILTYTTNKDLTLDMWDTILAGGGAPATDEKGEESADEEEGEDEEEEDEDEDEDEEESEAADTDAEEDEKDSESEADAESDIDDADSCNDEEDGGGKRRAPRRRTAILEEFRRMEMGIRSRVQFPIPPTKRAPRWQTAAALEREDDTITEPARTMILSILTKRLAAHLTDEQQTAVEHGIFQAALQNAEEHGVRPNWENPAFVETYKLVARRVIANLDPDSYIGNKRLIVRLKEGEFLPHQVAFMTPRELFPEHWQELADEQLKRETTMLEGNQGEGCDLFKCRRCGKSRTRYWEMQTRSADEPMTVFIRCLNCGKEWRQ